MDCSVTEKDEMEDDEAALLAELRAISQKSAASRFDDEDGNVDSVNGINGKEDRASSPAKNEIQTTLVDRHSSAVRKNGGRQTPPWKRSSAKNETEDAAADVVASPQQQPKKVELPWKKPKEAKPVVDDEPDTVVADDEQPVNNKSKQSSSQTRRSSESNRNCQRFFRENVAVPPKTLNY